MDTIFIGKYEFEIKENSTNNGYYIFPIKSHLYPFQLMHINKYLGISLKDFCIKNVGYYRDLTYLEAKNLKDLQLLCKELTLLMDIKENKNYNLKKTIKKVIKEYGTIF